MEFLWGLWQKRWLFVAAVFVGGVVGLGLTYLMTDRYTARVTLLPYAENQSASMLGQLASLTGANLGTGTNNEELYGEIITSDRILDQVVARRWAFGADDDSLTVYEIFDVEAKSDDPQDLRRRDYRIRSILRNQVIDFRRNRMSGFMDLAVTAPEDPEFAADLANYLIVELDRFNQEFYHKRATSHRQFLSERMASVERNLEASEDSLTVFRIHNRAYRNSPRLLREHGELEREVQAQTSIWIDLRRQLELAKFDEHRQTVSLELLDRANVPVVRSSPKRKLNALLGGVIGGILALLAVLVRAQINAFRENDAAPGV
jgi:uncharacterized protein involved in exopolysaccharide biosynthesis